MVTAMMMEREIDRLKWEHRMARRETLRGSASLRAATRRMNAMLGGLRRCAAAVNSRDGANEQTGIGEDENNFPSSGTAVCGRRSTPIRKKIIGHGMFLPRATFTRVRGFRLVRGRFALLDEPARQHGASVFLEPLIEKRANFLAEIGGVTQAREFVALERVARGREKKLPRRLRLGTKHRGLLTGEGSMLTHQ